MSAGSAVAVVGFGEVGQTLAADLLAAGVRDLVAWDRLFSDPASAPRRALGATAVRAARGIHEALAERTLVISAVTAAECLGAASEAARSLPCGAWYLDLNSVAPETKISAACTIETAGGRYVEAAVMSPIAPRRIASPILLGGAHASDFLPVCRAIGFTGAQVYSSVVGGASAAETCRSVMVKGLEALIAESLLTARRYGAEQTVLDSLNDLFPVADWPELARYMLSRSLQHGRRRAEEMREVARTVSAAGLDPWMSTACAARQDWAASRSESPVHEDLRSMLDAILAEVPARREHK